MKVIALLFITALPYLSYAQLNQRTYVVSDDDCITQKAPTPFFRGDTVILSCDTMYLLNPARFRLYRELHEAIKLDEGQTCKDLILTYEQSLADQEKSYAALLENAQKSDELTRQTLDCTQQELTEINAKMHLVSEQLAESQMELKTAEEKIKKGQKKSNRQKLFFGAGSAVVGLMIGAFIVR